MLEDERVTPIQIVRLLEASWASLNHKVSCLRGIKMAVMDRKTGGLKLLPCAARGRVLRALAALRTAGQRSYAMRLD
jgi:hypothetical protein